MAFAGMLCSAAAFATSAVAGQAQFLCNTHGQTSTLFLQWETLMVGGLYNDYRDLPALLGAGYTINWAGYFESPWGAFAVTGDEGFLTFTALNQFGSFLARLLPYTADTFILQVEPLGPVTVNYSCQIQ
jgi:hypothetical protein